MRIIRFFTVLAVMAVSAAAASAQISLGGSSIEPLGAETEIVDLSSPAGSGTLLVSVDVDYPDGSDSTFYYVTSSMEAAVEAAGVAQSEISNMMTIHNEDTISDFMKHFQDRFPKIEMWFMISAVKESENQNDISAVAYGQGTEPFFCSEPGMVRVYEARDADGKTVSFNADSLADFTGDFTQGHATVISTVTYPEDTSRFRSRIRMRFDRGEVIMDMAALMEEAMQEGMRQSLNAMGDGDDAENQAAMNEILDNTTVSGECRGIPADIYEGMELPDYSIEIKIMFITSKMGCKDRKVIGRESVTTPAGTFDCYVIEETMTAKAMMVNEKTRQVSWYARGVGLVKQQTFDKKKLTGTTLLTAIR